MEFVGQFELATEAEVGVKLAYVFLANGYESSWEPARPRSRPPSRS